VKPTSRPDGSRERPASTFRAFPAHAGWWAAADLRLGQGIVEYGLILSLSAGLAVVLLVVFGGTLSAVLDAVGDAIDAAT
jgi:Flp pilus assembly pilin Flp